MRSLSARLTLSLAISLATFFIVQSIIVGLEIRRMSDQGLISRLEHDAEDILAALVMKGREFQINWERIPVIYKRPFSGHYFQLRTDSQRHLRSRSLWDEDLTVMDTGVLRDVSGPLGQRLFILSKRFRVHGKDVLLSMAEDISRQEASSLRFLKHLLILSFTALLLLLAMQIWVIRQGLKPLAGLGEELIRLERGETDTLHQQVPSEISPLVNEINRLLLMLRHRLGRYRNSMGNLAHALKTPLTRIMQILEREPSREDRQMVIELVKSIEKRIQRELSRARMAGQSPGGFWPDPHQDIRDLAATLEAVNRKQGLIKLLIEDDIHFAADREDMMELIGNLLDNACKWAKRRVYLNISSTDGLEISVDDDGPGMDENRKHEILSRGGRADESMQGHGLGLAIVQDIVKAYHGALHIGHSDSLGGLRVSVTLPDPATIVRQQKN